MFSAQSEEVTHVHGTYLSSQSEGSGLDLMDPDVFTHWGSGGGGVLSCSSLFGGCGGNL